MNKQLAIPLDTYNSETIEKFLDNIKVRKCIYYASDILNSGGEEIDEMNIKIQHTISVFHTLDLSVDEHFQPIFRCSQNNVYKDWKISELASVYLSLNGDPTDLNLIAHQQSQLIDLMIDYINDQNQYHIRR